MKKEELEAKLNEMLGVKWHWAKMPREDLDEAYALFSDKRKVGISALRSHAEDRIQGLTNEFAGRIRERVREIGDEFLGTKPQRRTGH